MPGKGHFLMGIRQHVDEWLAAHGETVIGWRRHFHTHPELSHQERHTTEFITTVLREHGMTPTLFPTTGLMVDIGPGVGPRIAFRADLDAHRRNRTRGFSLRLPWGDARLWARCTYRDCVGAGVCVEYVSAHRWASFYFPTGGGSHGGWRARCDHLGRVE